MGSYKNRGAYSGVKTEPKYSSVKPRRRKWFNNNNKSTIKPEINENQTWWFNVHAQKQTMMCGNKVEEMMNRVRTWKSLTPAKRKEEEMPPAKSSVSSLLLYLEDSPRNLFGCSLFSSSSSKFPSSDLTVTPILVAAGAYLPGQAITCFPVSAVSSMASFISSMTSLVAGPTHGERSSLLLSGAASSSNIYKKTKYPLALQRGSTNMPLFGRVHECKEHGTLEWKVWIVSAMKWTLPKNQGDPHKDTSEI